MSDLQMQMLNEARKLIPSEQEWNNKDHSRCGTWIRIIDVMSPYHQNDMYGLKEIFIVVNDDVLDQDLVGSYEAFSYEIL